MKHGDIVVHLKVAGEPQRLLTYWRGSLKDVLPVSASIVIRRPARLSNRPGWRHEWYTNNIGFEPITRTEFKRAELSISEKSLDMQPPEIEVVRHLTKVCYDWLSQRQGMPATDKPMSNARLYLECVGGPELVGVIEKFDLELLRGVAIGPVYTQGEPRKPGVRWLPDISSRDKSLAINSLEYFEKLLAPDQRLEVRKMIEQVATLFRRRVSARRGVINKKGIALYGIGDEITIDGWEIKDEMLDSYEYEDVVDWFDRELRKARQEREARRG